MHSTSRVILIGGSLSTALAAPVLAAAPATMDVTINIPQLKVAEYHRPYVAIWVEKAGAPAKTVAVWYDYDMKNNEGTKWLRDVRQWWRAAGRTMTFPANGITGATRAPGAQKISFSRAQLSDRDVDAIARYVTTAARHPRDAGGWGIGHIGPIPEGLVAILIGGLAILWLTRLIGERR